MNQPPPLGRRERKKEETRQAILAAASELFKEKGYEATAVDEIVNRADIVKGTFYYHFESKEQVLVNLRFDAIARAMEQAEKALERGTAVEALSILASHMAKWSEDNPELAKVFYAKAPALVTVPSPQSAAANNAPRVSAPLALKIAQIIKHGQKDALIRDDMEALCLAEMFMFMLFHAQMAWVADGQCDSAVSRVEQWVDVLLHGLIPSSQ
jgi:AcrR family transcriptional regulator